MTNPNHPTAATPALSLQDGFCASYPPESILLQEIRILRERGLSDEAILDLLSGFNIDTRPEPLRANWNLRLRDQLIRLIWGQPAPLPLFFD